jgi:hypothetical protein
MAKTDHYRRLATECFAIAEMSTDERSRVVLLHIAEVWNERAEEAERVHQQQT